MSTARKPKTAKAVHANAGIEAAYRKRLQALIAEMHGSVDYWLQAGYKKHPPRMAALVEQAQDAASPAQRIKKILKDLADRWVARFEEMAPKIAEAYVKEAFKATDGAFRRSLKEAGLAVEFQMTPAMRDSFQAQLAENVGLIKSIPQQYLQQVEGVVMRGYSAGRDLQTMVAELKTLYPKAAHRAELIARDQSNKANAVVIRTRRLELGLTRAIWMHSHAGKNPRPSHVKAGADKREFDVAVGCLIDGEYIQPGEEINCRCTSRTILPI